MARQAGRATWNLGSKISRGTPQLDLIKVPLGLYLSAHHTNQSISLKLLWKSIAVYRTDHTKHETDCTNKMQRS